MTRAELRALLAGFPGDATLADVAASLRPRMPSPPEPTTPPDDFGREGAPETEDAAEARAAYARTPDAIREAERLREWERVGL